MVMFNLQSVRLELDTVIAHDVRCSPPEILYQLQSGNLFRIRGEQRLKPPATTAAITVMLARTTMSPRIIGTVIWRP
jgi:hypothetical protein